MKSIFIAFLILCALPKFCLGQSTELNSLKQSLPQIADSLHYVNALNRIAILFYEKNIDSTFYYTIKAREIADRHHYEKGKADATNNIGIFFDIKGNLQLALRYYDEALVSYTKQKDSSNIIQAMMNIAMVYKEIGKDRRAIERYNDVLRLGKRLQKDSIMSLAIYNYLLQFPSQFKAKEKEEQLNKAKKIAQKYKDYRTLLAINQLHADELISNGEREKGLALLDSTINAAIDKQLYYVSMDMLIDMGNQLEKTVPLRAVTYYEKGLTIASKNGYLIYTKILARKLFDFHVNRGESEKAVGYGHQLINALDLQEALDNHSGVDYLDYALKEQQLQSLITKNRYQLALIILAVVTSLLAIIIIIAIRKNLKRTKHLNRLITKQNEATNKTLIALEQSQADNTRMMKIAAHDLRNPVGGIYALATFMLAEPNRSAQDIEVLETIKTAGKNSLDLVNDLLEIQFNTADFRKETIDIDEILHYCVAMLMGKAVEKDQKLVLQSKKSLIPANREKLWRVISNLITNAIKFSPVGSSIEITAKEDQDRLLISIKDYGIGIPPKIAEKIFDMFTEAGRQGTDGEQTYGLGLAISKQIVEAHKGEIWFESEAGKGTVFYVSLPRY